jgi:drug/metabolite transporter (DMT)-like permease
LLPHGKHRGQSVYGPNFVVAKGIMPDFFLPRAIIFLRIGGTLALLWMLHFFLPSGKVEKKDLFKMARCSVSGVATNQILFFEGLNRSEPIGASIISTVIQIIILIFSHFILKEKKGVVSHEGPYGIGGAVS